MPELPEVETVRRGLDPFLTGATINEVKLNRPNLRFPFPINMAKRLEGQTIQHVGRRAKYLVVELSSREKLLAHLGMSGSFKVGQYVPDADARVHKQKLSPKHDHVAMRLTHPTKGEVELIYNDPRRFGYMDLIAEDGPNKHLDHLGPEPLSNQFSADHLATRFTGKKSPVKTGLLDQRIVAGLGNIYVCEALFEMCIDPFKPMADLAKAHQKDPVLLDGLTQAIKRTLMIAIEAGGSTLKDFKNAQGDLGYFQHQFRVYGREGEICVHDGCGTRIERRVLSGRSTFMCPTCQS
ncbi:bifunctional DNA-formamidopyrimidine glycosylase/DNA-(apurinic or apyrimidinic site) lyase [Maritalea mediterranea]|uniref:Formamidopyrimidine-DNA glycosylase n=1 Tax=Maritalea mediterranea TaxID=2909667 RepID=A0ABS9E450_9HYPH|nr:bifunctional DNA-formamidopyrimidine glycosylase/DNA-(apurinic or apyrimidinic site) lyase [Maritalea mediterranea]MCF4097029.1 bifunctional DNA-formamidopyrimidine glycosylase/DNA-(apurinic or apyrimidinic site) lyase [Maritalea mediterranea]